MRKRRDMKEVKIEQGEYIIVINYTVIKTEI